MSTSPHHVILGGQRSGKSSHAERLGRTWLQASDRHEVVVLATASLLGDDPEMQARVQRHRQERPAGFLTVEEPRELGRALADVAAPHRLVIVDCLTLWLSQVLPVDATLPDADAAEPWCVLRSDLLSSLARVPGAVLLVSNEIGCGVIPLGAGVRAFVDELGRLNQDVTRQCGLITWMVAGQPFTQKVQS